MGMNIIPFIGLKDITLGMNIDQVRTLLGPPSSTRDFDDLGNTKDWYRGLGIITTFDTNKDCESIEFYLHAAPLFEGHALMGLTRREIKKVMSVYGEDKYLPNNKTGIFYPNIGISFYMLESKVKSVMVFPFGYYENLLKYYI